ncbi:MAG: glycerol-3-phosphate 1-O-acyltransferase PlsY [Bacteroidales bacterium]|nr:glycerol-3-phosphate 1-O-acyltransferase PlsY [Bacteroidales bacterium]MCF8333204.1 glycerol-3-phosphate 1-O-acyltransferase PlsY [Bacteroidales bacterium]
MEGLVYAVTVAVAYFIGSFSTAVWLGKWYYNIDVREHGSGNAGATNTLRVLGTRAGITVLLIDVLKGWIAVFLAGLLNEVAFEVRNIQLLEIAAGIAVVSGHIYPLYTKFQGGKGIATMLGVVIALFPWQLILIEIGIFALVFVSTRYVSLGSIVVALALPVLSIWFFDISLILQIVSGLVAVVVPVTHRGNVKRLKEGRESKISFDKEK